MSKLYTFRNGEEEITAAATDNIQNSPHECNINVARHWCMTISVL